MGEEKVEKIYESPEINMWPNDKHTSYHIEIELPGADKSSIKLKMHEDSFFIKAETDEIIYIGSYATCCDIDPSKAKAAYNNGLLKIDVPFKEVKFENIDVKIE